MHKLSVVGLTSQTLEEMDHKFKVTSGYTESTQPQLLETFFFFKKKKKEKKKNQNFTNLSEQKNRNVRARVLQNRGTKLTCTELMFLFTDHRFCLLCFKGPYLLFSYLTGKKSRSLSHCRSVTFLHYTKR